MQGQITAVQTKMSKTGKPFYILTINGEQLSSFVNFPTGSTIEYELVESNGYKNMKNPHQTFSSDQYLARLESDALKLQKLVAFIKELGL